MVNRYCIMYKYNSINHTNEKTEAFYCLKNNYDKEKTKYYTSSLSDNRNHIIVFSQYFRYRRQWKHRLKQIDTYFPIVTELLPIAEQCREVGFTEELTRRIVSLQPVGFKGRLYSKEHKEKFRTEHSTATIERNPQEKGKFRLCIDGMPILEWFKMKFKELKEKLGVSHTQKEENKPMRGLKI